MSCCKTENGSCPKSCHGQNSNVEESENLSTEEQLSQLFVYKESLEKELRKVNKLMQEIANS